MQTSPSYQPTVPLGSGWDYAGPGAADIVRVRLKGYVRARPPKSQGSVYLVPDQGGARVSAEGAHELPPELQEMTVVKFWELVDQGCLERIDSPSGS